MNGLRWVCLGLVSSLMVACGGGGGDSSPSRHSISGTVSGVAGANIALSGAASKTATADASGHFQFTDLEDGTYTLAPSLSGYSFDPACTTVVLSGADRAGVDFSGSPVPVPTHAISGTISPMGPAVSLSISDGETTTQVQLSDAGSFSIPGLVDGYYTLQFVVDASRVQACTALVLTRRVKVAGADVAEQFSLACTQHIAGTVSPAQPGLEIHLTGNETRTTLTDASGAYSFPDLIEGTYAVTPAWPPAAGPQTAHLGVGNVDGVNFTVEPAVILFPTPGAFAGNLGGRAGADQLCAQASSSVCPASSSVHAVLSVSDADAIANMPANFGLPTDLPIRRPSGTLIVSTWADIFGDALQAPIAPWIVYWTGSTSTGALTESCAGWTSSASSELGRFAYGDETTSMCIDGSNFRCDKAIPLLCACW